MAVIKKTPVKTATPTPVGTRTAVTVPTEPVSEDQQKVDILTGIVDKDARTYTMQKTITIGGERREGTFLFRYPTIADRLRQGTLQARYLGGVPVASLDVATYSIAFSMAFLASITEKVPAWFTYEDMESTDELQEMFVEVNTFVNSFRRPDGADTNADNSKDAAGTETVANS